MLTTLRATVLLVALLNLAYFGVEFTAALAIDSVSLFADSIDFLEDTAVNLLVLTALGWSARKRALVGMATAAILLMPSIATLIAAWEKLGSEIAPAAATLSAVGLGALAVNSLCAVALARVRNAGGSLGRAAFLSARNDALANIAIIATGFVTAATASHWPDLVVGLGILAMNADAARAVYMAARSERAAAA